ncbi:Copper type II ascorbate-dependent monooxygenase, C-terminal domain [Nannocystis exedens]|uniref:Copper type II ascorbate-dependent monooxygenase, C-terminal domain n=1 Tax=Nannocystis exedens TaxID=54 RepID=A0A1I1YRF1_9BACT|nr:hypothetical protein [Nannocystis exedens]PCC70273.1 hypothetical protein NAEX_03315 [Nannocystis exedens]SFE20743.1 Copper type II ascorbate-dependent monooxygenase, C-terminal domain [Nannocystis exedens]
MLRDLRYLTPALLVLASACKDEDPPPAEETITYWQDVAPIFFKSCVGCHAEGGIAPFRLDNYEDASTWAQSSAAAVAARTMPPWLLTADGSCGEHRGSLALSQEQIDTITAWADADAPEGEPRDDLEPVEPPRLESGLDLVTPEFVPKAEGGPLAAFDEYRCFLVEPGLDRDKFITGYEVIPGNPQLVHHVIAMPVDLDAESWFGDGSTNRDVIEKLDAESPDRDGWPCFSAAGEGVSVEQQPVTWAPGMGVVDYPAGTGVRVRDTDVFVVQIHYNLHDGPDSTASDSTQVRLRLEDSVEREGVFLLVDHFIDTLFDAEPASLPPGKPDARYEFEDDIGNWLLTELGAESLEVHGIFPHMHERGRKWHVTLADDAGERCIGDVQRWDFAWQLYYFFTTPPLLTPTSRLKVTCEYDTSADKEPITPGWGTQNEMCLAGLFVVPPK